MKFSAVQSYNLKAITKRQGYMFYAKYRKIKFTKIGFLWKEFLVPINTFFSFDFGKMSHLGGFKIQ